MGQPLRVRTTQGLVATIEKVSPNQHNYSSNQERDSNKSLRATEIEDANVNAIVERHSTQTILSQSSARRIPR
jgi:hypothetical protein